jgi:hypothetical protein
MPLTSTLGYSTFISAKKILSDSGLFIFKPDKSIQDGRETVAWMVKNLHGSRMKEFWEKANAEKREPNSEKRELNAEISDKDADSEEIGALYKASILGQSQSEQRLQETSQTVQEHLTNSSKEFVRCVSDTLTGNSREEETAHAPLGVASPQTVESVSEKEEDSPTANDCTRVTLLDDAQGESALLLAENQDCGIEQKGCHVRVASRREGGYSAAPVAQNEECLSSAMSNDKPFHVYANQTPELVEQGNSAPLLVENSVSGVEVKAAHEGQSSVAPVLNPEKWSHEAIVARSNVRPERMQKLKVAGNSGQNPGFEYLQECWDDPALVIVIKKLIAKFPQWGVVIRGGELVEWEG